MAKGFTDQASEIDRFNIMGYINGLSRFIMECNTPMTIGIQGDWGTGKTSIMSMIRNILSKNSKAEMIWFNTWQFSQFNMGNDLALSLISTLLDELEADDDKKQKIKTFLGHIGNAAKNVSVMMVDSKFGGEAANAVRSAVTNQEQFDLPGAIRELKGHFEKLVLETLERKKKERIIIFVDDLDRLQPAKAVELLEVLKLFLDSEKCVFLLAIDYQVVLRGVAEKYGQSIGEDKGKSFFDKIIQVPFKMPVAHYDINNFIVDCFNDIGIKMTPDDKYLGMYADMIRSTIGQNPRSMKRLFNAFLLLTAITQDQLLKDEKNKQILFAFLCLQQSNDVMYDYIVRERKDIATLWEKLIDPQDETITAYMVDKGLDKKKIEQFFEFMNHFKQLIDVNGDEVLDEDESKRFQTVLDFSTITAADTSNESKRYERQQLNTLEELVAVTQTTSEIVEVYKLFAQGIREIIGTDCVEKYYAGQGSVSFYMKSRSGRESKLCEIKLNKTALTLFLIVKADRAINARIEDIVPGTHNTPGHSYSKINGITDVSKMAELLELVKLNHVRIFNEKEKIEFTGEKSTEEAMPQ